MSVSMVFDRKDKFRAGAAQALRMRLRKERASHDNEYLSMSLFELCKRSLDIAHIPYAGANKLKVVGLALSQPGSDFPGILENVLTKEVLRGYTEATEVYPTLARIGSLPDFKPANRSGLGHAPDLVLNRELQEVELIELGDRKETIQLATYAARTALSRQSIINDDLNEFARMVSRLGASAKRTVGGQFANVFTQNADGQTLTEGSARIFAAARNNTGTGGAPSTTTFDEFRKLIGIQKSGDAYLNIVPRFIYCPRGLEGACNKVVKSEKEVSGNENLTTPNTEQGRWEVIADARLDAASTTRYYALADPNEYDTVEVAFLDGRDEPSIERVNQYDVLGVSWVVWIDCVAQALDYRTMAVNDGA